MICFQPRECSTWPLSAAILALAWALHIPSTSHAEMTQAPTKQPREKGIDELIIHPLRDLTTDQVNAYAE